MDQGHYCFSCSYPHRDDRKLWVSWGWMSRTNLIVNVPICDRRSSQKIYRGLHTRVILYFFHKKMEETKITWLEYGEQDSDWLLAGDLSMIKQIQRLPIITVNTPRRYSQKIHARHKTSCTKFAPINAFANIFWYNFSRDEINEIEDLSIQRGFRIWWAWTRWQGVDTVRTRWNAKFPKNQVDTFVTDTLGKEFDLYLNRWYTAVVSIRVDIEWMKDIALDGDIDGDNFGHDYWHATAIRMLDNGDYQFIDSAFPRRTWLYTAKRDVLERFMRNAHMQTRCHIILPHNTMPMIAKDVPTGQRFSDAIARMIKEWLTTETDKFRPQAQVTRAEMAVFLKRLYDKLNNWQKDQ